MLGTRLRRVASGAAAVAMISVVPVSAAAAPASWRMADLGTGDGSVAVAVNELGHVAVTRADGEGFLWRHGRATDLGAFTPTDVNDRDEVVGYRTVEAGTVAVVWRNGVLTDLATAPGGRSVALGINGRSEIVGWSTPDADGAASASLWRRGVRTSIAGGDATATDLNDLGQVVGNNGTVRDEAVRWWHGTETPLSDKPGEAMAVNRFGTVTGVLFGSGAGFVWQRGKFAELPPEPGEFPYTQPAGINDRGQVAGTSSAGAFVWERGTMTVLPGRTPFTAAGDINDRGVIAGSVPATPENLEPHAVIWVR